MMVETLPRRWDLEADVVVLGSGAAGFTAAAAAHDAGARVVLLEKSDKYGGATALSGAVAWVPNNHHIAELGATDSREEVLTYLHRLSAVKGDEHLMEVFADTAPVALKFLEEKTPARFIPVRYPDYHPEFPGGKPFGRSVEPALFDLKPLGELSQRIETEVRPSPLVFLPLTMGECAVGLENLNFKGLAQRHRDGFRSGGKAFIMPMLQHCIQQGIGVFLETRALELITSGGAVVGVRAEREGRDWFVRARRGVVIATGGFEWNPALVKAFLRGPMVAPVTPPSDAGDGLVMAQAIGAQLGNMSEAWWSPCFQIPGEEHDGQPLYRNIVRERCLPGTIFVNRKGRRFVNEAHNYNDIGRAFHTFDPVEFDFPNIPAWMVYDHRCKTNYIINTVTPHNPAPPWMTRADTIEELATKVGIDPLGLVETIERFNRPAREGRDPEFRRGESIYDHHNGDPNHRPNPSLEAIDTPPYYALPVYIGTIGTKGGPKTNEHAQVLDVWGEPIPGLFAAGNAMAVVTGMAYAGAGGTIGPAIAFGYLAGRSAAAQPVHEFTAQPSASTVPAAAPVAHTMPSVGRTTPYQPAGKSGASLVLHGLGTTLRLIASRIRTRFGRRDKAEEVAPTTPAVRHVVEAKASQMVVWNFVKDMGNWAILLPGFQTYEERDDRHSHWVVKVDIGPFTRVLDLEIEITEWVEPNQVAFTVACTNEPFTSTGAFLSERTGPSSTKMIFDLSAKGTGMAASMLEVLAPPVLALNAKIFAQRMVEKTEALQRAVNEGGGD